MNFFIKPLQLKAIHKSLIWILLSLVTSSILLFPTYFPGHEYHIIQSIHFFGDRLLFFSVLFYIWLILLFILLLSEGSGWEKLMLTLIFTIVVLGFWTLQASFGKTNEEYATGSFIEYIRREGKLGEGAYFPAIYLLGLFLGQVTGLETMSGVRFVTSMFAYVLLGISAFLLFEKTLQNKTLACFAAMLLILGNIVLTKVSPFQHRLWGPIFVIFFLILAIRSPSLFYDFKGKWLALVIYCGLVMMHLPSSLFLIFIMSGMYLMLEITRLRKESYTFLALMIVIFLAWQIYIAVENFEGNLTAWSAYWGDLLRGEAYPYERLLFLQRTNVGESFPLWANLSRTFWWGLIFIFGSILCCIKLFSIRMQSFKEQRLLGGFIGIALLSMMLFVLSPGGREATERFFFFVPLFTIPFIMKFFSRRKALILLVLFFVFSLPTFYAHNNTVALDAIHYEDIKAATWLRDYGSARSSAVLSSLSYHIYNFYLPHSYFLAIGSAAESEDELQIDIENSIMLLRQSKNVDYISFSKREMLRQERAVGIKVEDPCWEPLHRELYSLNRIYVNGFYDIFRP